MGTMNNVVVDDHKFTFDVKVKGLPVLYRWGAGQRNFDELVTKKDGNEQVQVVFETADRSSKNLTQTYRLDFAEGKRIAKLLRALLDAGKFDVLDKHFSLQVVPVDIIFDDAIVTYASTDLKDKNGNITKKGDIVMSKLDRSKPALRHTFNNTLVTVPASYFNLPVDKDGYADWHNATLRKEYATPELFQKGFYEHAVSEGRSFIERMLVAKAFNFAKLAGFDTTNVATEENEEDAVKA